MPAIGIGFDTIPDSITQRALANNFSVEEKSRRKAMIVNKEFYYDKQAGALVLVNEDVDPATINLTRPIVKKRSSLLYRKKLVRDMTGSSESISFLEQVYEDNDIDSFMANVDLLAELTGSVLVHPMEDPDLEGGVRLVAYDSSQFSAIADDDNVNKLVALSLIKELTRLAGRSTPMNPQVEMVVRQQVWTENAVVTYNGSPKNGSLENQLVAQESNPLGFVPFVNIKGEAVNDQYLGHAPATTVRLLNATYNQTLTNLLHIVKMQGFTPIALAGYQSGEAVSIHPGRAFSLPAGANAFVLSTDPKIREMLDVLTYLETKCFETSSVPLVSIIGGEGESGRELMVRFFPLVQVFEDKARLFQKNELELANLILRTQGLEPLESLLINYPEDNVLPLTNDDEMLEQDLKFFLKTPMDELMRRDPDLTETEAEAIVRSNKDFNEELFTGGEEDAQGQEGQDGDEEPQPNDDADGDGSQQNPRSIRKDNSDAQPARKKEVEEPVEE